MFVHVRIARPASGHTDNVLELLRRWGAALGGQPGLLRFTARRDAQTGHVFGTATWRSREHWDACGPAQRALPTEAWVDGEDRPDDVYFVTAR